ncbi:MAG: CoA transferase [Rhodomicrobium sp.]|nr:CoA transferase [Rhodomicrobium sp.]
MDKPLKGLRVLELARILAGPWAGQLLADLGAEVIKVERPGAGDDTRGWGPPFVTGPDGENLSAAYYHAANRGKRSLAADFETEEGRKIVRALAERSDVLIENFKAGGLTKYGLGYDSLKEINPRLVYCSITGFGQTGPYAARAGYDFLIQGMGGVMSLTGAPEGEPMKAGMAMADIMTGLYASNAILAALRRRDATGQGAYIDMALLDCQVAWLINEGMNYLHTGKIPKAWGTAHATIVPYQAYPTADGHFILAVGNDRQFRAFCDFAGQPALADDARFQTNALRVANRAECDAAVKALTAKHPTGYWIDGLSTRAVPCGPVNTIDKVFADPQVKARNMVVEVPHSATGKPERYIASPIKLSETPVEYRRGAPRVGEHTEEVLSELLGMDKDSVARLRTGGVV